MKIHWNRLVILGAIYFIYAWVVVVPLSFFYFAFVPYLCLALLSVLFLLAPRRIFLILTSGLVIWPFVYYAFFYFYNPFTIGNYDLYVHPRGLYEIEYPSSWQVSKSERVKGAIFIAEPTGSESDFEEWTFSQNGLLIGLYSEKLAWPTSMLEGPTTIEVDKRATQVYFFEDGGSTCTLVGAELRIPTLVEGQAETLLLQIMRSYNSDNMPNPQAISPQRLLEKASPLLKTFKLRDT